MMKEERQHLMGGETNFQQHHQKDKSLVKSWQKELYEAWRQFAVLTRKNFIMMRRNWTSTLLRFLFPSFWLLILFIISSGVQNGMNTSPTVGGNSTESFLYPRCSISPCYTLGFAPNTSLTRGIMQTLCELNTPKLNFATDLIAFSSRDELYNYTMRRNIHIPITGGVSFDARIPNGGNGGSYSGYEGSESDEGDGEFFGSLSDSTFDLEIFLNQTSIFQNFVNTNSPLPNYHNELKSLLDMAILTYVTGTEVKINAVPQQWPDIPGANQGFNSNTEVADMIISWVSCAFFFISFFIYFPTTLSEIGRERRLKLREGMEVMGLKTSAYWASYMVIYALYTFVAALIFVAAGFAFGFPFFRLSNFMALFWGFWFFAISLVAYALWFSTFATTPKSANVWSFVVFFVFASVAAIYSLPFSDSGAGLLHSGLYQNDGGYSHYFDNAPVTRSGGQKFGSFIIQFFPIFNFAEFVFQVNSFTVLNPNSTLAGYPYSTLKVQLNSTGFWPGTNDFAPTGRGVLGLMIMNIILYYLLAWYFDKVRPNDHGVKEEKTFFLKPSFWGISKKVSKTDYATYKADLLHSVLPDMDPDIIREYQTTINLTEDEEWKSKRANKKRSQAQADEYHQIDSRRIVLRSLKTSKTYRQTKAGTAEDIRALDSLCVSGEKNSVLCFLGHNGAGKTTAINCLTGLESPTSGDALVWGYSVKADMDKVRRMMGVCPQHDILWPELSAKEHLRIYCTIKRVPDDKIDAEIAKALADVKLTTVGDHPSSTYSGGMKRRLSVAISLLGDPKIVFLDEPTSGMDPGNRRNVWDLIERAKKDRIVVLTTHSMEEADVLGDKICIFALGRLRAIGDSLHLKNRFGRGYHISVLTSAENSNHVKEQIQGILTGIKLDLESVPGNLSYSLPFATVKEITEFFSYIEKAKKEGPVEDWGISHTTLEEVFLRITHGDGGQIAVDNRDGGGHGIYDNVGQNTGFKQLNIVLEGRHQPLGFVEVNEETTLEQVRHQISYLDGVPSSYSFLSQGVIVSRRQESQRQATQCLPVLTLRAEPTSSSSSAPAGYSSPAPYQPVPQPYKPLPPPLSDSSSSSSVLLEQRISELQRVIDEQEKSIRGLQENLNSERQNRMALEQENQNLQNELHRLRQELQELQQQR